MVQVFRWAFPQADNCRLSRRPELAKQGIKGFQNPTLSVLPAHFRVTGSPAFTFEGHSVKTMPCAMTEVSKAALARRDVKKCIMAMSCSDKLQNNPTEVL